jgi:hypothetical protein
LRKNSIDNGNFSVEIFEVKEGEGTPVEMQHQNIYSPSMINLDKNKLEVLLD